MAGANDDDDLLSIGQFCSMASCGQLDFLPVTCHHCQQVFCKLHSFVDAHGCTAHVEHVPQNTVRTSIQCQFEGCSAHELTEIVCPACRFNFCLKHRHQDDHHCKMITVAEEKMKLTRQHIEQLQTKQKPKSRGRKSQATAAKVMLMKIKMKAEGNKSIPECERIYLQVALPLGSKDRFKPMFFSKKWSVGRVVDVVANKAGLINQNNLSASKKLRLFDISEGTAFSVSSTVEDVEQLISGSVVVMEYVDNDIICIGNLEQYQC